MEGSGATSWCNTYQVHAQQQMQPRPATVAAAARSGHFVVDRDVRSDFWRRSFEAAAEYDAYLSASPEQRAQRWIDMAAKIPPLTSEQTLRLTGYRRPLRVLLMSSDWCGDCARQGPMIKRVADAGEEVELRVVDRDANPALRDELRIMGAMRVPVAVFLTEEFFEVGRSSDRTLGHYKRVADAGEEVELRVVDRDANPAPAESGQRDGSRLSGAVGHPARRGARWRIGRVGRSLRKDAADGPPAPDARSHLTPRPGRAAGARRPRRNCSRSSASCATCGSSDRTPTRRPRRQRSRLDAPAR